MHLSDLKHLHVGQLIEMAIANEIDGANRLRKQDLLFALLKHHAKKGESIIDVRISRLRRKLEDDSQHPTLIKTVYGAGYLFVSSVGWE